MLISLRQTATLSVATAIALLFAGCGESKVSQCNKVIKVANQASLLGKQYGQNPKSAKGSQGLIELASKIEQVSTQMKGLDIKDSNLQGFQGRFFNLYQGISQGLNNTAISINKKNFKEANSFLVTLQKNSVEEGTIVTEINNYCSGK